ncbi:hypothetical protein BX666DRAFT_251608 [Dichotomocladium elegans]|nr:hypothetical protein BX666DRAFT_251608 [Dichotomocladium elegans]
MEIDPDTVVKCGHMLCRRAVRAQYLDDQPTKYQYARQIDEWHQYCVKLTYTHLEIYSTPALIWPRQRLEYCLNLKQITRFGLLSPLDYTFFVRYPITESRHMAAMFSFRALSVTLCREWYMMLYRLLPENAKPVCSPWCEVHISMLDMQVRLPLWSSQNSDIRYDITLQSVQEAVLDVLEKDERWSKELASKLGERKDLAMCWTRGNRTEWVYWRNSAQHAHKRIDLVVSPQHIEQTHRLELRHVEHTPRDIILTDGATLCEPPPVEGYLTRRTTFFGKQLSSTKLKRRRQTTHRPSQAYYTDCTPEKAYLSLYDSHDQLDKDELSRRMTLMTEASRIIDLTEMSYVRRSFEEEEEMHAQETEISADSACSSMADSTTPVMGYSVRTRGKPLLEMVMNNGIVLKFESETPETCDAWVRSLTDLSLYWRAQHEAERDIQANQDSADILSNQYQQTVKGVDEAVKDLYKKPEVDTRIWSICWYTRCRDVVVMYD